MQAVAPGLPAAGGCGSRRVGPQCYSQLASPDHSKGGEVDVLQVVANTVVVTGVGSILAAMTHGLRRELKSEIASLRAELKGDIAELRVETREMRSDLTRVALAVGAERRAGNR
jgi:hypothetical protein